MKTEVDLDDETYSLASLYASARGITLGDAIGELIRQTRQSPSRIKRDARGFPTMPSRGGLVTSEAVKVLEQA